MISSQERAAVRASSPDDGEEPSRFHDNPLETMADAVSTRSRSVRAAMQSSERHQTGAHAADSVSSERLLPEHRPSDHAGQQFLNR